MQGAVALLRAIARAGDEGGLAAAELSWLVATGIVQARDRSTENRSVDSVAMMASSRHG